MALQQLRGSVNRAFRRPLYLVSVTAEDKLNRICLSFVLYLALKCEGVLCANALVI